MGHPRSSIILGIPSPSWDGKYHARYPRGDMPGNAGELALGSSSYSGYEGSSLIAAVSRTNGSTGAIAVDWTVSGLTEGAPVPSSGTLTWANGETGNKTITTTLGLVTTDQSGSLTLSNPRSTSGGAVPAITASTATLSVLNSVPVDDPYTPRTPLSTDKYLDFTAGSDGSGTASSPWNTLSSARVSTLVAGQQLVVRGTGPWPDCTGAKSGTAGNRIVVRSHPSYPGSGFTFTGVGARLGGGAYWDFYKLTLACQNTGLCLGEKQDYSGGSASTNFRAIDCAGTRSSNSFTDNSGVIFATNGARPVSVIRGSYTGVAGGGNNQSLIWLDYTRNVEIIGVLLDQCANPIYFKHTDVNAEATPGGVVRNCIIRRAGRGFQAALNWVQYINCVFDSCKLNIDESGGGIAGGNNCVIEHCTFLNSDIGMEITDSGTRKHINNILRSNVLAGSSRILDNPYGINSNEDQGNLSDYSACAGAGTNHFYRNGSQRTLSAHKLAFPTQEIHGVAGTVTLVGGGSPGTSPANWALASGSVGQGAAHDGTDCGVDASKLLTAVVDEPEVSFVPLRAVSFNGLADGAGVVSGQGGTTGKCFDWCPGDVAYRNGYGMRATTAIARPGQSSSCAISIASGHNGDPADGDTSGAFGGGWGVNVAQGEEMWWGMWMFFPSTWKWNAASSQTLIKFMRLDHSASSAHLDYYVINGQYSYWGNGDSSSVANDKQSGSWYVNEYGSSATPEPQTKVTAGVMPLGQWVWVEQYVYAHSNPTLAKRRTWINGVFAREQVGSAIKWRASDGTLRTGTLSGGERTLQTSGDVLNNLRLFTYWNNGAPQNQTCYLSDMAFHKDPSTLPAVDEFGNKMMGPNYSSTGDIQEGSSAYITGTGFDTTAVTTERTKAWQESSAVGTKLIDKGAGWSDADIENDTHVYTSLSDARAYYGSKSIGSVGTGAEGRFGVAYDTGGAINDHTLGYYVYLDLRNATAGQWKMLRWNGGPGAHGWPVDDALSSSYMSRQGSYGSGDFYQKTSSGMTFNRSLSLGITAGRWCWVEASIHPGTPGNADGTFSVRVWDTVTKAWVCDQSFTGLNHYAAGETNLKRYIIFHNYQGNGNFQDGTHNTSVFMDSIHMQNGSREILYLGNAPTWSAVTEFAIQPITSGTGTRKDFIVNRGALSDLGNVWAYVRKVDGTVNATGLVPIPA